MYVPAAALSSTCNRDGMDFHSERLPLSSSMSFSRVLISFEMDTNCS